VFYLTKVASSVDGGAAQPVNANAKLLIDILTDAPNAGIPSGLDPVALVANKGLVPLCAMTVTRSTEGGNLSLFAPSGSLRLLLRKQGRHRARLLRGVLGNRPLRGGDLPSWLLRG
jgi:hypothetical protein